MNDWSKLDWAALDRLRAGFLKPAQGAGPYWSSAADLAAYDATYAERIGWKWDAVLAELKRRSWYPTRNDGQPLAVLDWGCGSGIASRRVISAWGATAFRRVWVWDHSPTAMNFALQRLHTRHPELPAERWRDAGEPVDVLVLSHVLNELDAPARTALLELVKRARIVLWVEPGTRDVARALQTLREDLRGAFSVVAPCPHREACGLLLPGNERHWCHHFASPPSEIFADSNWVKFGQRAGIDLRSLPYAFLVLDRGEQPALPVDLARVIGRPEHFKPYARVLACERDGVHELTIPKRSEATLYKHLDRTRSALLYRWSRHGTEVSGGYEAYPAPASH